MNRIFGSLQELKDLGYIGNKLKKRLEANVDKYLNSYILGQENKKLLTKLLTYDKQIDLIIKLKIKNKIDTFKELLRIYNDKKDKYEKVIAEKEKINKKRKQEKEANKTEIENIFDKIIMKDDNYRFIDSFTIFRVIRLELNKVTTLKQLYQKLEKYTKIINAKYPKYNIYGLKMYFSRKDKSKDVEVRTMNSLYLESYETFKSWVDDILDDPEKIKEGSDGVNKEQYHMILDKVDLVLSNIEEGKGGKNDKVFIEKEITNHGNNLCGYDCLIASGYELSIEEYEEKKLKYLDNLQKYILANPKVNLIRDNFKLSKNIIEHEFNKKIKIFSYHELDVKEVELISYVQNDNTDNYIVYDSKYEHYYFCEGLKFDNLYLNMRGDIIKYQNKEVKIFMNLRQYNENLIEGQFKKKSQYVTKFFFLDYEAVTDWSYKNVHKSYSVSAMILTEKEGLELIEADKKGDKEKVEIMKNKYCKIFKGFDCSKELIKYIEKEQKDTIFYFVTFNGSNYDNYLLYNACNENIQDNTGTPLINNGQLLNFKIFGRHSMFDLRKHVTGSLKECCNNFKVNVCKKIEDFSHDEMQDLYDTNKLIEFINSNDKLDEYNKYDVLSLAVIFFKYKTEIESLKQIQEKSYKIEQFMTLGMLSDQLFNDWVKENKINIESFIKPLSKKKKEMKKEEYDDYVKTMRKYYKDIEDNRIAGRVELFNGIQKIEERLYSLDVCSLYPYVMFIKDQCYYPCGDIKEVKTYKQKPKDKIGFFYCDIEQNEKTINIMAEKTKDGNNWSQKIINNVFISSVMIEYLIKIGSKVSIRNGIYFTDKIRGIDLFKYLLEIMELKNKQDELKNEKSDEYNPVLREIYKAIMNIQSGKLNQKLTKEERMIVTEHEFHSLMKEKTLDDINTINIYGNKAHISIKKSEDEIYKTLRNIPIGTLIYDYAKIYMHENIYTKVNKEDLIYSDTDSCKLKENSFDQWKKYSENNNVSHWEDVEKFDKRYKDHPIYKQNSKVFGSFEDEYNGFENNISYFLQKKGYICANKEFNNNKDEKYVKYHLKGVNKNSVIIDKQEYLEKIDELTQKELRDLYINSKKIKDNYIEFFDKLYTEKTATVLTFSIRKEYNNQKKKVTIEDKDKMNNLCYNIKTMYTVKRIKI